MQMDIEFLQYTESWENQAKRVCGVGEGREGKAYEFSVR